MLSAVLALAACTGSDDSRLVSASDGGATDAVKDAEPERRGAPSSLAACDRATSYACPDVELCFVGAGCDPKGGCAAADARCHRQCDDGSTASCGPGEYCSYEYFGVGPYTDNTVSKFPICCTTPTCGR